MSYAGEVQGGGVFVLIKMDDGKSSFPSAWLPNSYRFASEHEAEHFVKHLRKTWIPAGFIREVRTQRSKDVVNARWDDRKREVVLLAAAPASAPVAAPPAAALEPVEPEGGYEMELEPEPATLVDEERYRPSRKKLSKRRFSRELYRGYRDETRWYEREQRIEVPLNHTPKGSGVLSDAIRHDLRHLLAHGDCRFEISRRLVGFFLEAHGGKMPDKSIDDGRRRLNASKKKLFESYEALCIASEGTSKRKIDVAQSFYNRAEKAYAASGGDLSAWRSATSGEIIGSDENGPVRVKPPIMKNIWEVMIASKMEFVWEAAAPAISMLDLSRWLTTADAHAVTGWFSDHEWRGPARTMMDLIAALNLEEGDRTKLDLEALEAAELAEKMARSQEREKRLERFDAILNGLTTDAIRIAAREKRERLLERRKLGHELDRQKCKLPNLQRFIAKNGGDCSCISLKAWERFNRDIEEWKACIGCNEHWSDPDWRQWYSEKTLEIWGDSL